MNNPLSYFENLFSSDKAELKKRKMISDYLEFNSGDIINIDQDKGIIVENRYFYNEKSRDWTQDTGTIKFENVFNDEFEKEIMIFKEYILEKILEISSTGVSSEIFLQQISSKIQLYTQKADLYYSNYPFVKLRIIELAGFVKEQLPKSTIEPLFGAIPTSANLPLATPSYADNFSKYSFQWDLNFEDSEIQLGKLYDLLTENPPIIEGDRQEFINGFTQREVIAGINWMVLGKNKSYAKSSLIYFLQQLEEKSGLIEEPDDFNKKVEYVFRDNLGQKLSNIKQSKSQVSNNPSQKSRIDDIIEELLIIE